MALPMPLGAWLSLMRTQIPKLRHNARIRGVIFPPVSNKIFPPGNSSTVAQICANEGFHGIQYKLWFCGALVLASDGRPTSFVCRTADGYSQPGFWPYAFFFPPPDGDPGNYAIYLKHGPCSEGRVVFPNIYSGLTDATLSMGSTRS